MKFLHTDQIRCHPKKKKDKEERKRSNQKQYNIIKHKIIIDQADAIEFTLRLESEEIEALENDQISTRKKIQKKKKKRLKISQKNTGVKKND